MTEGLYTVWAKTPGRDAPEADRKDVNLFHPLLFHLLDVACVCDALWKHCLSERVRRRLVDSLGLTEEQARIAVILLAGLHDIGKAIPTFSRQQIRLFELTGLPDTTIGLRPLHAFASAAYLFQRLQQPGLLGWTVTSEAAFCLAAIVGATMGYFQARSTS